jgi:tetratricopeptide (TPR) repeat protein
MPIPFNLQQALETGTAILFVGAGMGHNMIDEEGNTIPDGAKLAERIADYFSVPVDDKYDLERISQYVVAMKKGKSELISFVKSCLSIVYPDEFMSWIPTIRWKAIFTTNYDNCIEKAYDQCSSPTQQYVTITHISGFKDYPDITYVPIIHLHGSVFDESGPEIIITQQDFTKYSSQRKSLFEILKHRMVSSCILYTGYSHNDANFNLTISDIEAELYPDKPALSYRIDPNTSEVDKFIFRDRNIETIDSTFTDFVKEARLHLNTKILLENSYKKYEPSIPIDYQESFHQNPAPVVRMFSSWQYVNQLSNIGTPDVYSFVRGNKASWSIAFNNKYFQRSIEDEIYDQILDYVTEPKKRVRVCTVTGSAGYGISTLLMIIAKRLVKENVCKVFFHLHPKELREGDIFFICGIHKDDKHIFFIDNAADYADSVRTLITHARENKQDIILVLGDRQNELLQSRIRNGGELFTIQPLSDVEIEGLIDFLSENKELNKLEYLDRSHQIAAIKVNYNRELLVAIREATEGKSFNAIIQDEFFGIQDTFSKKVYAIVACFHQHSALLRVELLSKLAGVSIIELYQKTTPYLNGVIYYELIDASFDEYAARSRHRFISEIVWNQCLTPGERDDIIHFALEEINIAYHIDRLAFQCFIRSDQMVDSLISLDSKIRFFDKACKIDPDNPYVMQHYARMLVRTKRENTALMIIDQAIKMAPSIRMLHHTRGYVLQKMAENDENIEVARRYLGQSEESFLRALRLNEKDAYCYQGLSSLYLMWVKKVDDEAEKTVYLSKAEDIVNSGLKKSNDKESIWIESSNIDAFLGNTPESIRSLQKAVKSAPHSTLSRYLLAKAYNLNGEYEQGKALLKTIVEEHPEDYKSSMEYAKSILLTGGRIEQAIAVLQQSTLFGYSDARFLATLGGFLFLNKQFSEATRIFDESTKREIFNAQKEMFFPRDYGLEDIFPCTISYIGNGYSYVNIEEYSSIRCNSSKYEGCVLTRGMKLLVQISFAPKYPKAKVYSLNI